MENFTIENENVDPNAVPTADQIYRQHKRLKKAEVLESDPDFPNVNQETVANVGVGLTKMQFNAAFPNEDPRDADLLRLIRTALQPLNDRFDRLERNLNTLTTRLERFERDTNTRFDRLERNLNTLSTRFERFERDTNTRFDKFDYSLENQEKRHLNGIARTSTSRVKALVNSDGILPRLFPASVGQFWALNQGEVNSLLRFYELESEQDLTRDKIQLAEYLGILTSAQ